MQAWLIAFGVLTVYYWTVQLLRYKHYRHIHQRYGGRYAIDGEQASKGKPRMIDSYRGVRDAQRILRLAASMDHPFVFTKSLEFALFRTYGIPTISSLLLHTGQLGKADNAGRRYVDTAGLIQSFMTFPVPRLDLPDGGESSTAPADRQGWEHFGEDPDDPRSSIALARVNFLHGRWKSKISNDDLLYTLSVFIIEPAKWIDRYEWRKTSALEKEAMFALFYHIGRCMGIQNIPETREELIQWSLAYEENYMKFEQCNHEVAQHTTALLMYALPSMLHGFATHLVVSLMDERLRVAMGYPSAPAWVMSFKDTFFRLRALVVGSLMLPRSKPLANIPIGSDEAGKVFSVENLLSEGIPGVCPASGIRADEGKTCPVGGHLHAEKAAGGGFKPAAWRMELRWYENEPAYARPFEPWSAGWVAEEAKIALGLLRSEDRRGAQKWMPATLPVPQKLQQGKDAGKPIPGFGGFRLEEMGPKGLELKGRNEVLANAEKLHGGKLQGKWAFEP
ncbi:hypothetical protein PaG_02902 [Moesziomyces aphidis]|jgi:hypothetical protein|uniref:ER-bound oxygenase mpaB/mpaB'/Rubber oxygenase catalytic domain-containing protein n=2 Tax=Moesziomyces TaxID=63261 RepID=M9MIC8_PSEA3|nr:hypothetical protein PaG_02902 [Moesziomyces aphidis]GAC76877.1 hypothetical protein PANT_22c00258 [Moesziomyces antarcticus T-34]